MTTRLSTGILAAPTIARMYRFDPEHRSDHAEYMDGAYHWELPKCMTKEEMQIVRLDIALGSFMYDFFDGAVPEKVKSWYQRNIDMYLGGNLPVICVDGEWLDINGGKTANVEARTV